MSEQPFDAVDEAAEGASATPVEQGVSSCQATDKKRVRIAWRDGVFVGTAKVRYRLEVGEEIFRGDTGAGGLIDHEVPATATSARLLVWPVIREGAEPLEWELDLGLLLPPDTTQGLQERLMNLGMPVEKADGTVGSDTKAALETFQDLFELEVTGADDETTKTKVKEVHESAAKAKEGTGWTPRFTEQWKPSESRAADPPIPDVGDE